MKPTWFFVVAAAVAVAISIVAEAVVAAAAVLSGVAVAAAADQTIYPLLCLFSSVIP